MKLRRTQSLGALFYGLIAFAVTACGKDDAPSSPSGPPPAWTTQAYDVQSTWHDTNEPTLTKKNVGKLVELWSSPLGLNSTVTVSGNRVYTTSASGVTALEADTGRPVWKQAGTADEPIGATASPTLDGDMIYLDNGSKGTVYALKKDTGEIVWRTQVDKHPRSAGYASAIVVGDRIFVGTSSNEEFGTVEKATFRGSVVALDKKSGDIVWQKYTAGENENGCAIWSTLAVDPTGGMVFAATGNNYTGEAGPGSDSIFAFDMATGDLKWHHQAIENDVFTINTPNSNDTDFGANPVVFDVEEKHYLAAGNKNGDLYVFNRDDGTVAAERHFGNGTTYIGGIFQALSWDGEHLYVVNNRSTSDGPNSEDPNGDSGAEGGVLFALEPTSLDIVWERQMPAWVWAPMTLANDMAFLGPEKHLEAVDLRDGAKLFDFEVAGSIIGAPVVNDGRIYVPSGLTYFFGHPDDKLHVLGLPDDPAVGKAYDPGPAPAVDLKTPKFSTIYDQIIAKGCNDSQCHGSTASGGLAMTGAIGAYSSLVSGIVPGACELPEGGVVDSCQCKSGTPRVIAGDAASSILYQKLTAAQSCGDRMPPTADPISDELQTLVKNWINSGANYN